MNDYAYTTKNLLPHYLRGFLGLGLTLAPQLLPKLLLPLRYLFALLSIFIMMHLYQLLLRHASRYRLKKNQLIEITPLRRLTINLRTVTQLKLTFFKLGLYGDNGYFTLTIKTPEKTMRLDSTINKFSCLTHVITSIVKNNNIELDVMTRTNLAALNQPIINKNYVS